MNNFKKLLTATILVSASSLANASALYINAPTNLGTDGTFVNDVNTSTDLFDTIVLSPLKPTSTYVDANNNGFVDTGEFVIDTGSTTVSGFSLDSSAISDNEGISTFWDLNVSWNLFGIAGVSGDGTFNTPTTEVLGAQFFGGSLVFDLIDTFGGAGNVLNAITLNITGSAASVGIGSSVGFQLFGDIVGSAPGVLFDNLNTDLSTVLNTSGAPGSFISMNAATDLDGLDAQPTDSGLTFANLPTAVQGLLASLNGPIAANSALLTRTTDVGSVDIAQVPEPTSLAILGLGLLGFVGAAKRRKTK